MNDTSRPRSPGTGSRRRFLKLMVAGSAAAAAGAIPAAGRAAARRARPSAAKPAAKPERPAALRAEIENQKRQVAKALETIRRAPLPPGAEPASVFVPLEPAAHRSGSGKAK